MSNCDFLLEHRLKKLDSGLAKRHAGCMSLFEHMLKKFLAVFPTFTDHTLLHTLSVTNITNQLLRDQVNRLCAEEIYIYLMASALHDIGMGVSDKDMNEFIDIVGIREYVKANPQAEKPALIRKFHNSFSWAFVMKYWEILEIPSRSFAYAIAQVGKGHRKTDLTDENEYPTAYDLGEGKHANLALLAAVIRIADELDIASDRNPDLLYDTANMEGMSKKDVFEFSKHQAIHTVDFGENEIVIYADTEKADIAEGVIEAAKTVKSTLDYCLSVIRSRSDISIDCNRLKLVLNMKETEV